MWFYLSFLGLIWEVADQLVDAGPEHVGELLEAVVLPVEALEGDLATALDLVDIDLQADGRDEGLLGTLLLLVELTEGNAPHEHPLQRKWFLIHSSGKGLLHFNNLELFFP
jgi:hypothetical protein